MIIIMIIIIMMIIIMMIIIIITNGVNADGVTVEVLCVDGPWRSTERAVVGRCLAQAKRQRTQRYINSTGVPKRTSCQNIALLQ